MVIGGKSWGGRRLAGTVSVLLLLSACAVVPKPLTTGELAAQKDKDWTAMFGGKERLEKPLTLDDAIQRVLKYNLDARARMLEQAIALGQTDLDRWNLLPKFTANAGYTNRSDPNSTKSDTSDSYSYSADQRSRTGDLSLTWNILDFGVSYFNARQNGDRALIANERRRKAVHNLVREVQFAFWRAAVAQILKDKVASGIIDAEKALADVIKSADSGARNPVEALRLQKTLLESLRQLEAISQELSVAKIELASLINLPPGADFTIAVAEGERLEVPYFDMPLKKMEELAFANNPDIREQGYQSRISIDETYKVMLQLLPGISFKGSRNYDRNSFLDTNHWFEYGATVTWNIFNLLSAPGRIKQAKAGQTVAEAQRLAIRMAVLAQVHVGWRQYLNSSKQFSRSNALWLVERNLAIHAKIRQKSDAQSVIDRVVSQTSEITAELRRYQAYAQAQAALASVKATLGMDVPATEVSADDKKVEKSVPVDPLTQFGGWLKSLTAKPDVATSASSK